MDIRAIKADIAQINSLPKIWALIETIDRVTAQTPHNEMFSDEFNPMWIKLVEIGALLSCRREIIQNGFFNRNGVMPYQTAEYASFKNECDIAAMWFGWPQNAFIGAEGALYDEEGNEDISDMLPGMAQNPMYV